MKRSRHSCTRRVLPSPASPTKTTTEPAPPTASRRAVSRTVSSAARPTRRLRPPRWPRPPARALGPSRYEATTDLVPVVRVTSSGGPQLKRASVAPRVAGPTRTEPTMATDCSAAATPITSPTAPYSTLAPPPMGPTTAGPVSMPIRTADEPVSDWDTTADNARNPARTARSGSSSCASGAPKIAAKPPPEIEVTVPPSRSTSAITAANAPPMTSRRSSGSILLASPGPVTSAKSTLTTLRSSLRRAGSGIGACIAGALGTRRPAGWSVAAAWTSSIAGEILRPSSSSAERQRS